VTRVLVINGPNLNLLGTREPDVYGAETLDDILADLRDHASARGVELTDFQSNFEGAILDTLHAARTEVEGIVMNPGAFTHYSIAIRDSISGIGLPVIETHLSIVHAREPFRKESALAPACLSVVAGFGRNSYFVALEAMLRHLGHESP